MNENTRHKSKGRPKKPKVKVGDSEKSPGLNDRDQMDFGGIPNRDLKKNLGCG